MESPYQTLTGFHLGLQEKQYHDYLFNRVAQQHPTFTRAQIEGVLDGSIGASGSPTEAPMDEGDSQEPGWTFTPPATSPSGSAAAASKTASPTSMSKWPQQDIDQYRQLQEAARLTRLEAFKPTQAQVDKDGKVIAGNPLLIAQADKYDTIANTLKEQNKDIGKPPSDNIPTADTPDAVAALPYGSRYWSKGHLFQSFSPTRGQGTLSIGGQNQDATQSPSLAPIPSWDSIKTSLNSPAQNSLEPVPPQWNFGSQSVGFPPASTDFIPTNNTDSTDATKSAPAPAESIPTIVSQSQYDGLPAGAKYRDSTGKLAIKRKR